MKGNVYTFGLLLSLLSSACRQDPRTQLPSFCILLSDSTTLFNTGDIPTGRPSILIHFDSDCKSCQEETASLLQHMDALKDVGIYFLTVQHFERLLVFRDHYNLMAYPNIVVGQDFEFFFPRHIGTGITPLLAVYDGKKQLQAIFKGKADIDELLSIIDEIQ